MKKKNIFLFSFCFFRYSFCLHRRVKLESLFSTLLCQGKVLMKGTGMIIREMVSSAIVNVGKFSIIERSLIDKILQEQKFSRSGMVDDNQIVELGKMAGADKVFLSVLSSSGVKGMLSLKMVDVKTASIERQAAKLVEASDVLNIITDLTLEALGEREMVSKPEKTEKTDNGGLLGLNRLFKKTKSEPDEASKKEKSEVEVSLQPVQQQKIESIVSSNYNSTSGEEITLFFEGDGSKKSSTAKILVDGILVGTGTLNGGFSLSFTDNRQGKHQVTVEWTAVISSKTYSINTIGQKYFEFEYKKGGFGYEFRLKD